MRDTLSVLYAVSGSCWTNLFESLPKDVAALPSHVCSSLSSEKLLDTMESKYEKFFTVSSASSLRMILAA